MNNIDDWMMNHGWTKNDDENVWNVAVRVTMAIPIAPHGHAKTRVVRDIQSGHTVETFLAGPGTKPEQVHRSFKGPRDIGVVMEVYGQKDEVATDWEDQAMAPEEQTRYRPIAARLNFLAVDRPDLLYAAKECSSRMRKKRNKDWESIKRICRYLIGCPRMFHSHRWQDEPNTITVYSDSDWAGCRDTQKSTFPMASI